MEGNKISPVKYALHKILGAMFLIFFILGPLLPIVFKLFLNLDLTTAVRQYFYRSSWHIFDTLEYPIELFSVAIGILILIVLVTCFKDINDKETEKRLSKKTTKG